jgi:segregation and condensation protein A
MEFNRTQDDYRVNLEVFEGPLDLLLYLIKKNDVDIYDIPIAFILEEYLRHLETLKEMDIDLAGEFLLIAAELAHIKSGMLLPGEQAGADAEDEGIDPRADLVRRLLEYQRYKEVSDELLKRSLVGRDEFIRKDRKDVARDEDVPLEASVYDLVNAFSILLRRVPPQEVHEVIVDRISVNDRIMQLIELLRRDATMTLEELLPAQFGRYDVVVTFLALLEMARLKIIRVYQGGMHDTIRLRCTMETINEEDMMRLVQLESAAHDAAPANDESPASKGSTGGTTSEA